MCTYAYKCFVIGFFLLCTLNLGPPWANIIIVPQFLKKCGNAAIPWSGKNTVLLFINMSVSWWKLYDKTCQDEINKLTCSWYVSTMRVHRDVEKTSIVLDWTGLWKPGSDRSSSEMYRLYIPTH